MIVTALLVPRFPQEIVRYSEPFGPWREEGKVRLVLNELSVREGTLYAAGSIVNVSKENVPIYRPYIELMVYAEWSLPSAVKEESPPEYIPNLGGTESEFVPPWCGRPFASRFAPRPITPEAEYIASVTFVYDSRYVRSLFIGAESIGWVPAPIGVRIINGPYKVRMKGNRVLSILTKLGKYGSPSASGTKIENRA